ncbi:MAG: hypothetical protein IJ174_01990, partial [Clostridia bacterium]|nr:hypothetical protein [Clostridia bacterium]
MSNRSDYDPRYTEHTSDQIIKGNETTRRENAMPVRNYNSGTQERHRRSDRNGDESVRSAGLPHVRRRDDDRYSDRYDDLPPEKRSVLPIMLIALGVVLLLVAVYLFLPANNPIKRQVSRLFGGGNAAASVEVLEFKATSSYYTVENTVPFTITTSPQARSVRLLNQDGYTLDGTPVRTNPTDTTMAIWTLSVLFQEPYEGLIYASAMDADGNWINSTKSVMLTVTAPTFTPSPTATPLPTQAVTSANTQVPVPAVAAFTATAEPAPQTDAPSPAAQTLETESAAPQVTAIVSYAAVATAVPNETGVPMQAPVTETPSALPAIAAAPETPVPETTTPVEMPVETATPVPTAAPFMAAAAEGAQPSALGLTEDVYSSDGKAQNEYTRSIPLVMQETGSYTYAETGVHTFRGDNMRQNAAFGTAKVDER